MKTLIIVVFIAIVLATVGVPAFLTARAQFQQISTVLQVKTP